MGRRLNSCVMTSPASWADDPFPDRSADDLDRGWGKGTGETSDAWLADSDADVDFDGDERLTREVPPHHGAWDR